LLPGTREHEAIRCSRKGHGHEAERARLREQRPQRRIAGEVFVFLQPRVRDEHVDPLAAKEPGERFPRLLAAFGGGDKAEVAVRGVPDRETGMIVDLGLLERAMMEARDALDHRFLDEMNDLGPATMENLSAWIWRKLEPVCSGLFRVTVYRDSSGEACSYFGPEEIAHAA